MSFGVFLFVNLPFISSLVIYVHYAFSKELDTTSSKPLLMIIRDERKLKKQNKNDWRIKKLRRDKEGLYNKKFVLYIKQEMR